MHLTPAFWEHYAVVIAIKANCVVVRGTKIFFWLHFSELICHFIKDFYEISHNFTFGINVECVLVGEGHPSNNS